MLIPETLISPAFTSERSHWPLKLILFSDTRMILPNYSLDLAEIDGLARTLVQDFDIVHRRESVDVDVHTIPS